MLILDLDGMLKDRETPAYVKEAIRTLKSTGHITVGSFIQKMSFADINSALDSCEDLFDAIKDRTNNDVVFKPINEGFISLSEVLSIGEGLETTDRMVVLGPRFNTLKVFLTLEGMIRKKFPIKIFYDNMSLQEESKSDQRPVALIDNKEETNASIQNRIKEMNGQSKTLVKGVASESASKTKESGDKLSALSKWLEK